MSIEQKTELNEIKDSLSSALNSSTLSKATKETREMSFLFEKFFTNLILCEKLFRKKSRFRKMA